MVSKYKTESEDSKTKVTNEELCSALLTHNTIRETAAFLKVSERTVYKQMSNKEFRQIYEHAQADIFNNTVVACQNKLLEAIECIGDIMNDKSVNAQTRLQAAQTLLKNAVSLYHTKEDLRTKAICETESIVDYMF